MTAMTGQMYDALVGHYRKPGTTTGDGELLLPEVQAPGSTRRCDLLRIGMWASRGRTVDVHEIKVSRADWQRELDDPAKAEAWWPYSSRFWIVAPAGMIRPEELPDGWGLMVPPARAGHRRFKTIVEPALRTPALNMDFLALLINRVENLHEAEVRRLAEAHGRTVYDAVRRERERVATSVVSPDVKDRLDFLGRLEAAMGMRLDWWSFGGDDTITSDQLAAALREYTRDHAALQRRAADLERMAGNLRDAARRVLDRLDEPKPRRRSA